MPIESANKGSRTSLCARYALTSPAKAACWSSAAPAGLDSAIATIAATKMMRTADSSPARTCRARPDRCRPLLDALVWHDLRRSGCGCLRILRHMAKPRYPFTPNEEANALLAVSGTALLIGLCLEQQ